MVEIGERMNEISNFSYQEFAELAECVELSTRALAFELGYNKQMLNKFPENSVDKMIVDEMYFGKKCFETAYETALKMKQDFNNNKSKDDEDLKN